MKTKETKALEAELAYLGIELKHEKGWTVVQGGNLNLDLLKLLPPNVRFENCGYLSLNSITSLPNNIEFKSRGSVFLEGVTSLPDNVKFENGGGVWQNELTSLPANIKFENSGRVGLMNISGEINYQGESITIQNIDMMTMVIKATKSKGEITLMRAAAFGGGQLKDLTSCYIAKRGGHYAHGDTAREAIDDVNFKHLQSSLSLTDIIAEVKKTKAVTLNQYRLLTGACRFGCYHFLDQKNIPRDVESLPLNKVLEMTVGRFGGSRMRELFS